MAIIYAICPKMKIVFTIPNFNTAGSGKALLNLAFRLRSETVTTEIVCNSDSGPFFQEVLASGIPVHVFDYIPKSRPLTALFKDTIAVAKKWRKINPDIVHSFHYSDNYTEGLAVRLAGKKWVFTKKNMSWGGGSGRGWHLRSAMANAIAVQNTDMIKQFYPNSKKTFLIPRGVVVEKFAQQPPKPEIRQTMATSESARIIICVANMVPVKGVELLIEAFSALVAAFPDWVLWLVGDVNNPYGEQLKKQVAVLGLEKVIKFSGKQPNVREYLDHAEIFVLPTKDKGEGSPVALLEAMANGKVVLGSAVPGVKDQLKDFKEHQFLPGNWEILRDVLQKSMENTVDENNRIGNKFLNHVKVNYNIDLEIKRHENFYLGVIK